MFNLTVAGIVVDRKQRERDVVNDFAALISIQTLFYKCKTIQSNRFKL